MGDRTLSVLQTGGRLKVVTVSSKFSLENSHLTSIDRAIGATGPGRTNDKGAA